MINVEWWMISDEYLMNNESWRMTYIDDKWLMPMH